MAGDEARNVACYGSTSFGDPRGPVGDVVTRRTAPVASAIGAVAMVCQLVALAALTGAGMLWTVLAPWMDPARIGLLRQALNAAVREGLLERNVARLVDRMPQHQ